MAILSNLVKWVAVLAFAYSCEGATVSSSVVYVSRNRSIATFAECKILVSVTYMISDLTLGTASHAIISGPGGELTSLPLGSVRNGQVTFFATFPLTSLGRAGGAWSVIINDGAQPHEDINILVPILNESSFANFPDFPTPSYQGDSCKVFAPRVASGIEASVSAIGYLSSTLVTNGIIYTFPAGGPFRVTSRHSISLPSVAIKTAGGQFLKWVTSASAKSESTILVNTGPAVHPFAGRCALEPRVRFCSKLPGWCREQAILCGVRLIWALGNPSGHLQPPRMSINTKRASRPLKCFSAWEKTNDHFVD